MTWGDLQKPSRTARKKAKVATRLGRQQAERKNKSEVRARDKGCRFPLCGCKKLGIALKARPESSHDKHKGMGGNPDGSRSASRLMINLCLHRHQDGVFSRHKGTIRNRYLDQELANDGPIAWDIKLDDVRKHFERDGMLPGELAIALLEPFDMAVLPDGWIELARERKPGQLLELQPWQKDVLDQLAEMEL